MAHGSKKWIVAYDGKIKRSTDRTVKDYYRGLFRWESDFWRNRYRPRVPANNCPQCKYVAKQVLDNKEFDAARTKEIRAEWTKRYGDVHHIVKDQTWFHFYQYEQQHPRYAGTPWRYEWRNYVCWKCERKEDVKDTMWGRGSRLPGKWSNYSTTKRFQRNYYRNEVRGIMQRARYDDELYETIPVPKHAWLD